MLKQNSRERTNLYATCGDFLRIFREDMKSLYLLALVLTADAEKAEQCFVSGLDDCASGNRVFKEWAQSWARRVVIKNAIRTIGPEIGLNRAVVGAAIPAGLEASNLPAELYSLLRLPAHERFVFVMSFCEGYSDHDCALLLGCTRETLVSARIRALQQITDSAAAKHDLAPAALMAARSEERDSNDMALAARLATVA